jgi:hypothetical protein
MSWCRAHSGTCDQILVLVRMLLSESCSLVSVGRPLWREDGSAICRAITQWFELHRTHDHALLSHLRLPQPGGPGSHIYIHQEQGGPVIPPLGTGFPLRSLLRLIGLWWSYSNPPPTWRARSPYIYIPQEQDGPVISHVTTYGQSISKSWCLVHVALEGRISDIRRGGEIFYVTIGRAAWEECSFLLYSPCADCTGNTASISACTVPLCRPLCCCLWACLWRLLRALFLGRKIALVRQCVK